MQKCSSPLISFLATSWVTLRLSLSFGNPHCWKRNSNFSFQDCCGDSSYASKCWDAGFYTFDNCCFTAETSYYWTIPSDYNLNRGIFARASLSLAYPAKSVFTYLLPSHAFFGTGLRKFGLVPCAVGNKDHAALHIFSSVPSEFGTGRVASIRDCVVAQGKMYSVSVTWSYMEGPHETQLDFCAPIACNIWEVVADLAPSYFLDILNSWGRPGVIGHVDACLSGDEPLPGLMVSGTVGNVSPPASTEALISYRNMFHICGECDLERYGARHDGGYLMCRLGHSGKPYIAAYSYGINGIDAWGESVSIAAGIETHQYDCFAEERPACEPPCSFMFHDECLAMDEGEPFHKITNPYRTLAGHLETNGHRHVQDGRLLLKIDVEGAEWGALGSASITDLSKFQQIVVEFHQPMLNALMDANHLVLRAAAFRRLLEAFVVVHVHLGNICYPPGFCIEVTFASRSIARPVGECRLPRRHPLDMPNVPGRADPDILEWFTFSADQKEHNQASNYCKNKFMHTGSEFT